MDEIKKQKVVMREAWLAVEAASALKSAAIDEEVRASEVEQKAFMAWRVELSKLKILEKNNE